MRLSRGIAARRAWARSRRGAAPCRPGSRPGPEARLNSARGRSAARQPDEETATGCGAVGNDVTVDAAGEPPRQRESEPGPLTVACPWCAATDARLEDTLGFVFADARAV